MLEPEVPYDPDYEVEDTEENWRDPHIISGNNARQQQVGLTAGDVGDNYDNYHYPPAQDHIENTVGQDQAADDCWMLPPEFTLFDVFGKNKIKLEEIRQQTKSSLRYNESKHQVDIWGDRDSINHAKQLLDLLVQRLHQQQDSSRRKTKKWGKPERELTKKERQRAERKQARALEERSYQGFPQLPQPHSAAVPIPDTNIPMTQVLGMKEEYLNKIRADCKSYMFYNTSTNVVQIAGENEENVRMAATRMRNLYLKNARLPEFAIRKLLKQPKKNMLINFRRLPQNYVTPRYSSKGEEQLIMSNCRLLEGLTTGVVNPIAERRNLIDLDDDPNEDNDNTDSGLSKEMRHLDERNAKDMIEVLEMGLRSIRLSQQEIKMKIRFGQIVITDYPKRPNPFSLETIANNYFRDDRFKSVLAPCIEKTRENMQPLFEWLSSECIQFTDSPRTTYTIEADQYPQFVQQPSTWTRRAQQTAPTEQDKWRTTIITNFTSERRVGLWNLIAEGKDIVNISCADLENDYSWELKLQSAQRFNTMDDLNTPHGQFIENLSLDPDSNNFVFVPNSRDYHPRLVAKKTKWVYAMDDWILEVGRDDVWDVQRMNVSTDGRDLPVELKESDISRVIYKFSVYRESWVNRFAENLLLQVGEAPTWTAEDFLAGNNENMREIIEIANRMTSVLNKEIRPYYDNPL
ncbi:hypothetical protein BDC45DRAFT_521719 [Circinella umbellata]|nr:hypothetical protein BDC45DRAFT_521719 [Circinella umbellata]